MPDLFESAWFKWAGGVLDSHVLADNTEAFRRENANLQVELGLWADYDPKRHCIVYTVVSWENPFPPFWGVMLGNIVHNFRSALDHVAWALYKRGRTPNLLEDAEGKVYYPITRSPSHFRNVVGQKLPGATRADIAVVRGAQPWSVGRTRIDRHPFWVLDELSRKDKHRSIHPVVPVPNSTGLRILSATDCIPSRFGRRAPRAVLEPGAELTRLYVRKTGPDPYADVEPHFSIDPSINARLTLEEFLVKTPAAVQRLLAAFSKPPEAVKTMVRAISERP